MILTSYQSACINITTPPSAPKILSESMKEVTLFLSTVNKYTLTTYLGSHFKFEFFTANCCTVQCGLLSKKNLRMYILGYIWMAKRHNDDILVNGKLMEEKELSFGVSVLKLKETSETFIITCTRLSCHICRVLIFTYFPLFIFVSLPKEKHARKKDFSHSLLHTHTHITHLISPLTFTLLYAGNATRKYTTQNYYCTLFSSHFNFPTREKKWGFFIFVFFFVPSDSLFIRLVLTMIIILVFCITFLSETLGVPGHDRNNKVCVPYFFLWSLTREKTTMYYFTVSW